MPLKRTKSELRIQRDSLKRFQRYLPTLQLKKQQLQSELILNNFELEQTCPDRFSQPVWIDDGLAALQKEVEFRVRLEILQLQETLIEAELRTTSQRVNLFEKVKIPECKDNIRIIRIALGDEQVAGVARGKLAKRKSEAAA
jgi:V/A-type H+-transporting ATPase subunit D